MHFLLVEIAREKFHVAATAIDLLFVLDCELYDQCLALVAERLVELGRYSVESSILSRFQTCPTNDSYSMLREQMIMGFNNRCDI